MVSWGLCSWLGGASVLAGLAVVAFEVGSTPLPALVQYAWRLSRCFCLAVVHTEHGEPDVRADWSADPTLAMVMSLVLFVFNFVFRIMLVEPLARRSRMVSNRQAQKFSQASSEALFYGVSFSIGLATLWDKPFFLDRELWWKGWEDGMQELLPCECRFFYIFYFARYLQSLVLVLLEDHRKDFGQMFLHHVLTCALCASSYALSYCYVGLFIMVLYDLGDVPLQTAKMFKYAGLTFLANRSFEVFAVLFFVTRIVLYSLVVYSAVVESRQWIPHQIHMYMMKLMLVGLLLMQCMWQYMIVQVALRLAKQGEVEDVRSDSDESDTGGPVSGIRKKTD